MVQSHIIEVDGAVLGAAIRQEHGYRFIAADLRVEELDDNICQSVADTQRLARSLLTTGRLPQRATA